MHVAMIGVGAMGKEMAGHLVDRGVGAVTCFDLDPARMAATAVLGCRSAESVEDAVRAADLAVVMVVDDAQVLGIVDRIAQAERGDLLVAVASTVQPATMIEAGRRAEAAGFRIIDAPVVYGQYGAEEGRLVSLCGGEAGDVERARPALLGYGRGYHHVGPLGAGMVAKTANNLIHWALCCANFEALLLVKRYGLDVERMREVLLDCPAQSGSLKEFHRTKLTWPRKDMDVAFEIAQGLDLPMPFFEQVDRLVGNVSRDQIQDLLFGEAAEYLGRSYGPDRRT